MAALRPWLLALVAAILLFVTVTQCDNFRISAYDPNSNTIPTEDFRPKSAGIASAPSCVLPDIVTRLTNFSPTAWIGLPRRGEGSIPDGFAPTGVVRCELNQPATGPETIDAVTYAGDVDAVVKALDRPSQRPRESTAVECAEIPRVPAALWLTSPAGAVRVRWPTEPCNVDDAPLRPLEALRETGRRTTLDLPPPSAEPCAGALNRVLGRPTRPTDSPGQPFTRRPTIELPEESVTAATICRYRLAGAGSDPDAETIGSTRLSAYESQRLLRDATTSAPAPLCNRTATEIANARFVRPDGSGGASLTIEVDGCQRLNVSRLTPLLVAPAALIQRIADTR